MIIDELKEIVDKLHEEGYGNNEIEIMALHNDIPSSMLPSIGISMICKRMPYMYIQPLEPIRIIIQPTLELKVVNSL